MVPSYKELIGKVGGHMQALGKDRPELMGSFQKLLGAAEGAGGALDPKTKELIALALAVGARCDPCVGFHAQKLVQLGCTRAELEDKVYGWGEEVESSAIDYLIHSLRKKLGADSIKNIRGVGYKFETE